MPPVRRTPVNLGEIVGAVVTVLTYLSFYAAVVEPQIDGPRYIHYQLIMLGLLIIGTSVSLMYLSAIRAFSSQ